MSTTYRVTVADDQGVVLFSETVEVESTGLEQRDARAALLDIAESVAGGIL